MRDESRITDMNKPSPTPAASFVEHVCLGRKAGGVAPVLSWLQEVVKETGAGHPCRLPQQGGTHSSRNLTQGTGNFKDCSLPNGFFHVLKSKLNCKDRPVPESFLLSGTVAPRRWTEEWGNVLLTTVAKQQLLALALLAFPQGGPPFWAHQRHMDTILKSPPSCRLLLTRETVCSRLGRMPGIAAPGGPAA